MWIVDGGTIQSITGVMEELTVYSLLSQRKAVEIFVFLTSLEIFSGDSSGPRLVFFPHPTCSKTLISISPLSSVFQGWGIFILLQSRHENISFVAVRRACLEGHSFRQLNGRLALCATSPETQACRQDLKDNGFYRHTYPRLLPFVGSGWTERDEKRIDLQGL